MDRIIFHGTVKGFRCDDEGSTMLRMDVQYVENALGRRDDIGGTLTLPVPSDKAGQYLPWKNISVEMLVTIRDEGNNQ